MKRSLAALLCWLVLVGPLPAATYHFNDADGVGGDGSIESPWGVDPDDDDKRESFQFLFDGTGTEAAAGDTINLCCGACDGAGSCTIRVGCDGTVATFNGTQSYFWRPDLDAFSNPITVQSYPGETVTISGDTNGDGVWTGAQNTCTLTEGVHDSDVSTAVHIANARGYRLNNLTFERWGENGFVFWGNTEGDWIWDGVVIDQVGMDGWGDVDGLGNNVNVAGVSTECRGLGNDPPCCTNGNPEFPCSGCTIDSSTGGIGIYLDHIKHDTTFKNGQINRTCGMGFRGISNSFANHTLTIEDSSFTNNTIIANFINGYDWENLRGQSLVWRRNRARGWGGGVGIENQNRGAIIEDSDFYCPSDLKFPDAQYSRKGCWIAIDVNAGNFGGDRSGANAGHIIRRNTIHGDKPCGATGTYGWLEAGISITDGCRSNTQCVGPGDPWCCCLSAGQGVCNSEGGGTSCSGSDTPDERYGCSVATDYGGVVENNMVWAQCPSGGFNRGASPSYSAVAVHSNTQYDILNNTIFRGRVCLSIEDRYGTAAHALRNNLVADCSSDELWIGDDSLPVVLDTNDIFDDDVAAPAPVVRICADATHNDQQGGSVCTATTTALTCAQVSGGLASNKCVAPNLFDTASSDPYRWNLHLRFPNVGVINAGSASGSATDFDGQARPLHAGHDIGADECPFSLIDMDSQPEPGPPAAVLLGGSQ